MPHSTDREHVIRTLLRKNAVTGLRDIPWSGSTVDTPPIEGIDVADERVSVRIRLPFPARHFGAELQADLEAKIQALGWPKAVQVAVDWSVVPGAAGKQPPIKQIKNIVAVASGKGGVGKSTTAANLALGLVYEGASVGLLDADIYGPSQVRMLGLTGASATSKDGKTLNSSSAYGIKVMSIGLLIDEEQPMVWRGPMVTQALNQLLLETDWGALDYLIVDMPPGTGDIQLTLVQRVPVSGAVIVTTPQDIALLDARKGLKMFQKVDVPVLGVVENMSTHICSQCGHEEHIFGAGGGRRMAEQYGVDLLAELPLDVRIREQTDGGRPTVVAEPGSTLARAYVDLALRAASRLAVRSSSTGPSISVETT